MRPPNHRFGDSLENLESPFLDEEILPRDSDCELFSPESKPEWRTQTAAIAAESVFDQPVAFTGAAESERAEAFEDEFSFEESGIVGGENRVRIKSTTGVPWRWICKIIIKDGRGRPLGGGTGVLVSDRHVLTAAHVVYDAHENMQQYNITVVPALDGLDDPFDSHSISSKPKLRKEYRPTAADDLDYDYALLTLSKAVGKKPFPALKGSALCYWGSPQCGANTVFARPDPRTLNGKAAYTAGYPGGKGGQQLWCAAGILHSVNERRRTMWITADTTQGQSGSPVWVVENGRYYLVGIAAGVGKQSNIVVRVTRELIRQLRAWIIEDGETPSIIETEEALESSALTVSYSAAEHYEPPAAEWSPRPSAEEAEDFSRAAYGEAELKWLHEQPLEEQFDPSAVPKDVADARDKKDWPLTLRLAIAAGIRDETDLTDLIFFTLHSELPAGKLDAKAPNYKKLSDEWTAIRNKEVRPAIYKASENTDLKVSGSYVAERDPLFSGDTGKKFKELVAWAAIEVDINPGLLSAVLLAEWDRRSLYLGSAEVRSFVSGTDDFYAQRRQLGANVPAFSKVRFDEYKKTANTNEQERIVTTVFFKSGKNAALATAVYMKYAEIKLRKAAQKNGVDFESLPAETRFALVRIAMAAGHGGISPEGDFIRFKKKGDKWVEVRKGETGGTLFGVASRLERVLKGEDVLVRKNEPRKDATKSGHATNRNATILAAQAMHLSDWMFGVPLIASVQPELEGVENAGHRDEQSHDPRADPEEYWPDNETEDAEQPDPETRMDGEL